MRVLRTIVLAALLSSATSPVLLCGQATEREPGIGHIIDRETLAKYQDRSVRAPAPGDACSLLTKDDAAAALGEAATGPKATGPMTDGIGSTVSGCGYEGSGLHSLQLNLTRLPASVLPTFRGICAKKTNDGLTGLGDVSCWYNAQHEELQVIKGNAFISIELRRSGNPTEPIVGLMKKALARLK